jgi:probable HAF family extracellular repeat protein
MKSQRVTCILAMTLLAVAVPVSLVAQDNAKPDQPHQYHHYQLNDVGTFGGPNSSFVLPSPGDRILNNNGAAVGGSDTSTADPLCIAFNFDCYVCYGFKWQDGVAYQLGALPGLNSSFALWVNDKGLVAGLSENGVDPLTGGPAVEAVLWGKDGAITDLGTLGGNDSLANAVNNRGQVAGEALNTIPDPYTSSFLIPGVTQVHAFRWTQSGGLQDLGTLGGTDSTAFFINDRGQIGGWSFTNTTVNSTTGIPTLDPFLWENGKMLDLGTLGGTVALSYGLNNRGQVVGRSNLAGDLTCRPFLWDKTGGMQDLGTLGGDSGFATWLNDAGQVVGVANLPGGSGCDNAAPHHAFLWKNGVMTDLGTVDGDPCSHALGINAKGQVVGTGTDCSHELQAFLWENGGPMVDLNALIPPNSGLVLWEATYVNDSGDIAALGTLSNGDLHAFVLTPCDENHPGVAGCDYSLVDPVAAPQRPVRRDFPVVTQPPNQSQRTNRFHMPGLQSPSR